MICSSIEKEAEIAIKQTNKYIKGGKQNNTKTFHKIKCTQRTTAMNTISKNIKNINHIKKKGKTTVK